MDYENPVLASPQRRFLMKEVQSLSPERVEFPTLAAEQLAAEASARAPQSASEVLSNRMQPAQDRYSFSLQRGEGWEAADRVASSNVSGPDHPSPSTPRPVEEKR